MSISTDLIRIKNAKTALKTAINNKGGALTNELLDAFAAAVDAITAIPPNSIVITAIDDFKRITAVDASSFNEIFPWQFWNYNGANGTYVYLTSIILSDNLTAIGTYAFRFCFKLVLTSLPDGVTSIGSYAFHGCANILLTSLPSSLISIGQNAFNVCTGLSKIWIPISCITITAANEAASPFLPRKGSPEGELAPQRLKGVLPPPLSIMCLHMFNLSLQHRHALHDGIMFLNLIFELLDPKIRQPA
jgi:hypothetical protein